MSGLLRKLQSLAEKGNESERKIAENLLEADLDLSEMSTIELGNLCGVSNASVVRFTQKLGYKGYPLFKFDYLAESKRRRRLQYNQVSESTQADINNSSLILCETIASLFESLKEEDIDRATFQLQSSKRIAIFSQGPSILVAEHLSKQLMLLNRTVLFHIDSHLQRHYCQTLEEKDVLIVLGNSQENSSQCKEIEKLRQKGVLVIAITAKKEVCITEVADILLSADHTAPPSSILLSLSQIIEMSLCDLLLHQLIQKSVGSEL